VLKVEGVAAAYGAVTALRGIDLAVAPGELVCLIGANGAGKSSTLRAISGLLRPSAGRIVFDGREIQGRKLAVQRLQEEVHPTPPSAVALPAATAASRS